MNEPTSIPATCNLQPVTGVYQCEVCCRCHDGHGGLVGRPARWVPEAGELRACNLPDCRDLVKEEDERRRALRKSRKLKAESGNVCGGRRPAATADTSERGGGNSKFKIQNSKLNGCERGCPADSEDTRLPGEDGEHSTLNIQRSTSKGNGAGENVVDRGTTARELSQAEFVSSGAAAPANVLLVEFFERRENGRLVNAGLWFPARMLVEVVMRGKSLHMNNRAVDVRPYFLERHGLFLDNWMVAPNDDSPRVSCYGLFPVGVCKSLSPEEKGRLFEEYGRSGGEFLTTDEHG